MREKRSARFNRLWIYRVTFAGKCRLRLVWLKSVGVELEDVCIVLEVNPQSGNRKSSRVEYLVQGENAITLAGDKSLRPMLHYKTGQEIKHNLLILFYFVL